MRHGRMIRVALVAIVLTALPVADRASAAPVAARLHESFETYFQELLERDAVFASEVGDDRYNNRLENFLSEEYLAGERRFRERWLERIHTIDRKQLAGQDRLSYDIFELEQENALAGLAFPRHLLPVSQLFSVPSLFVQLGSGEGDHPFRNAKDYRDFLARIDAWTGIAEQIVVNLRTGIARGVVQPRILMQRALEQLESQIVDDPTESVFYDPLREMPEGIDERTAEELRALYRAAIRDKIVPSYRKIYEVVRDEYLPACRDSVGLSALPNGEAWYAHQVRVHTTSELSPREIHALGLAEVERIQQEMRDVLRAVGFEGDLTDFLGSLKSEQRFSFADEESLLLHYRGLKQRVEAAMPRLFDRSLDAPLEILPVPAYYAASAPAAIYNPGSPDGSRPGTFYVNTHDLGSRPTYQTEALFLHEALPGHHFQSSLARTTSDLPQFRRFVRGNAYIEGWGLYSESLGKELGLYTDPYSYFGRLDAEVLRALRLVVDTGIHAEGWTREQAIEYMTRNSAISQEAATAEVERYIAWPGQALSYKLGELTLQRLRRRCETRLGDRFDIRVFHRQVLGDGVLPLAVLEQKIDEWLEVELGPEVGSN